MEKYFDRVANDHIIMDKWEKVNELKEISPYFKDVHIDIVKDEGRVANEEISGLIRNLIPAPSDRGLRGSPRARKGRAVRASRGSTVGDAAG